MQESLEETGLNFLWEIFNSIKAKGSFRPKQGSSVEEIYEKHPEAYDIVNRICADEIRHFKYEMPNIYKEQK